MKANHKSATIVDVAKAAGVSISTVSRVINDYAHVRLALRVRVQAAMEELHYVPNRQARRLVGSQSGVVGLMVHALGTEYIAQVTKGIDDVLFENDYDLMLYTTHRHPEKEVRYAQSIANGLADGLLIVVPSVGNAYLNTLQSANFPHVLVDVDMGDPKSWSVGTTNWQGAFDATTYLLELKHERIGLITDQPELSVSRSRLEGYKAALKSYGIDFDPALVREDNYMAPYTWRLVESLLALDNPPTAIFTTGDMAAVHVMETLRLKNIRVPQDMSVVGFDDVPQASATSPALTTVYHPLYEMGRVAAKTLLEQIEKPGLQPRHIQLETRLRIRESCALRPGASSGSG
jgi:LacI family transcriptional regulator